eukprot:m51a1_g6134 putative alcohol dehydrogenase (353) ;mRNA; r:239804-241316
MAAAATAAATATTQGWVATTKGTEMALQDFHLRPLGPQDVEVDIICSGLCHTDVHMTNNDWGITTFPIVPGHEGVGRISAVGPQVRGLKVGQMVGVGWIRDCCGSCLNCQHGEENICHRGYVGTIVTGHPGGVLNTGTFAHKVRIAERFAFPIPEGLDPIRAAPLLCAGMTVYQPLRRYITHPGLRVGVIGIGGLGHLAVKFARAMGAEVYVFSGSPDKRDESLRFGAHHFVCSREASAMAAQANSLDFILDTAPAAVNWEQYIGILRAGGVFCLVGIPVDSIPVPTVGLVFGQKSVVGSIVSGSFVMNEMLNFCAINQIYPECEIWEFSNINAAAQRVLSGKARYRIVLKW